MLTSPRPLLQSEGAFIFVLTLCFYHSAHYPWWLYALLFFAPDLAMLAYLKSAALGAAAYNLVHTLTLPILLLLLAFLLSDSRCIPYALIWLSHIALDRMLGYGLKYPTAFKDTHLQHV